MTDERLLGFDVREQWRSPAELWDEDRRNRFLLRLDVARPLSVDVLVWPSVFDTGQGGGLPEAERQRLGLAGIPMPSWTGPNAGLWDSLPGMREYLAEHWSETRPHAVIAVSWLSGRDFAGAGGMGPYLEPTTPAALDPDWRLLGLDVADGSLVSGLANCGYSPEEAEPLRSQWAAHLNHHHLFDDPERAFAFRDLTNARVLEHAPFFVYGVYVGEEG